MKDLDFYFMLEKTYRKMRHGLQKRLRDRGAVLTLDQWMVLRKVSENEGISQISLAESLNKEAPSVTRMVDVLLNEELIAREINRDDRRKYHLVMTEKGKTLEAGLTPPLSLYMEETLSKAFEDVGNDQTEVWLNRFELINRNL